MAIQGGRGRIEVFEDFNGLIASTTLTSGTALRYNDIALAAASGNGTIISTVDEGGGILDTVGAGGAADGVVFSTTPAIPSAQGTLTLEVRCKNASATDFRFFAGFQQTFAQTEPIMPFTLSVVTLTAAANAGECVGFYYDSAATTDDFRFMSRAEGAADTTAALDYALGGQTTLGSLGVRANTASGVVADRWFVARIEMDTDGTARGYFGSETMGNPSGMTHIATIHSGPLLTTAAYFPVLHLLSSSGASTHAETDYFRFTANRDWAAD